MSLRDKLVSRFRAQLGSKLVTAVTGGALTVGLARLLEPNGYGVFSLALAISSIFMFAARFGIARSAGRYVAEYKETDGAQIPYIIRTSLLLNVGSILAVVILFVASHRSIAARLNQPALVPFLLLGCLFVVFGALVEYTEHVIQGFEAITFAAILRSCGRLSRLFLALGLVIAGFGAIGALWGYVLSLLLATVIGGVYLYTTVREYGADASEVESGLRRRIAKYALPVMATNASLVLDKRIDTLLVGFFLSPVSVSYYVVGGKIVSLALAPIAALSFTISPTFGAQKAAGNVDRVSRIYEKTLVNALLLYFPAGAGIILVADPMINLVFGPDYSGAVAVVRVLGLYIVLSAVVQISDNGLDYLGRARERAIARLTTALMNVGLNILLIPAIGVVGAAIATVFTRGLYTVANLVIITSELDLRPGFLLRKLGLIAASTIAMSTVVFGLMDHVSGWLTLGLVVTVGVLVWGVMSVATGLLQPRSLVGFVT